MQIEVFFLLFLTLEKAGLQVNLISESEMYSIILYVFGVFFLFISPRACWLLILLEFLCQAIL